MKKRLMSLMLILIISFTLIPSEFTVTEVHASIPGYGDRPGSSVVHTPKWRQVSKGNTGGAGTFIADNPDDPFFLIKAVAKAKTSTYYYNTVGWTLHTDHTNGVHNPDSSGKVAYVPIHKSDTRAVGTDEAYKINGSATDKLMFYNHDGNDKHVESIVSGGMISEIYKVDKSKLVSTLVEKGIKPNSSDGIMKLYFSGANRVTQNGGSTWRGPYKSREAFRSGAGPGLWSVVSDDYGIYFDVPVSIRMQDTNVEVFYDALSGKRLSIEYKGRGAHETIIEENYHFDGQDYKTVQSNNYPFHAIPETNDNPVIEGNFIINRMDGKTGKDLLNSPLINYYKTYYATQWSDDKGGENWDKFPKPEEVPLERIVRKWDSGRKEYRNVVEKYTEMWNRIRWNNKKDTNLFGNTTVVWLEPVDAEANVVSYDKDTGKVLRIDQSGYGNEYEFEEHLETPEGTYTFVSSSTRDNTSIEEDIVITGDEVTNGGSVMGPLDTPGEIRKVQIPTNGIGRSEYELMSGTHILYYDGTDGQLIKRERRIAANVQSVVGKIEFQEKKYVVKQTSYKINKDPEDDIATTTRPVMGAEDKSVTRTSKVILAPGDMIKPHIVRVEMEPEVPKEINGGVYIIPPQHLSVPFQYKFGEPLVSKVDPDDLLMPPDYSHTYSCGGCKTRGTGKNKKRYCPGHNCNVKHKVTWGVNQYDWVDDVNIITPNDYRFAGKGTLTKVSAPFELIQNAFNMLMNPGLPFTSHRKDVDNHIPTFAKYMDPQNKQSLDLLNKNKMNGLTTSGLKPVTNYTAAGGQVSAPVTIREGTRHTPHGREYEINKSHAGCGAGPSHVKSGYLPPHTASSNDYMGTIKAQPSILASQLPVAPRVKDLEGDALVKKTLYQSPKEPLDFYPTYKMFANGLDAWVLGKEKRSLMPIDVFEIQILNTDTPLKVNTTWSRDSADVGKLSMKGGYQYAVTTNTPVQVRVTSYIHVPKKDWVADSEKVRTGRLKTHTDLVTSMRDASRGRIFSNLPESYRDDYPSQWKINNPLAKSGDNKNKSRMSMPVNYKTTLTERGTKVMQLNELDTYTAGKTNNVTRLNNQLEKKDWYIEKFEGFEVVKTTTDINVTFDNTMQTNFIRNGGPTHNSAAKSVMNIPSTKHGVVYGVQDLKIKLQEDIFDFQLYSKPFLFDVRGTAYDDRY